MLFLSEMPFFFATELYSEEYFLVVLEQSIFVKLRFICFWSVCFVYFFTMKYITKISTRRAITEQITIAAISPGCNPPDCAQATPSAA